MICFRSEINIKLLEKREIIASYMKFKVINETGLLLIYILLQQ